MVDPRKIELDELVNRPGTYFNPQTEVLLIVNDPELDAEILNMEEYEGADWVLISDEVPVEKQAKIRQIIERWNTKISPTKIASRPTRLE